MIRKIPLILLLFVSIQAYAGIGDDNDFLIISQNEYSALVSEGEDLTSRRYIIVPALDHNYKDLLQSKDETTMLAKFSYMLKENKEEWIYEFLKNCNDTCNFTNLLKGLYYFSVNQYFQSISYLEKFENNDYRFLKLLLIADCKYEILQDKRRYNRIIVDYQQALSSTDNEQYKSIVNNRIEYIKYH